MNTSSSQPAAASGAAATSSVADDSPPADGAADSVTEPQPTAAETGGESAKKPSRWQAMVTWWHTTLAGPQWWHIPVLIFLISRVFTTLVTATVMRKQQPNTFTGPDVNFSLFSAMWDGRWYRRIAEQGYPQPIPSDALGNAHQSEWAFFPAYPTMVKLGSTLTGLDFPVMGVLVNFFLGLALAVLLYDTFATRVSPSQAALATALVVTFPASPVLQYTYTETLALICVVAALRLLAARAYTAALLPVAMLAITRPIAVPLGLVMLVHLIYRWVRRHKEPFSWSDRIQIVVLGLFSAVTSVAFPLWVGAVNNEWGAYNRVQASWHSGSLGYVEPWFTSAARIFGSTFGPVAVVAVVAMVIGVMYFGRGVMGTELTAWVGAYSLYLFVVLQPWTSLFRYMLFLFPLALVAAAGVRSVSHAATWIWAMLSLQVVWISWLWHFSLPFDIPP